MQKFKKFTTLKDVPLEQKSSSAPQDTTGIPLDLLHPRPESTGQLEQEKRDKAKAEAFAHPEAKELEELIETSKKFTGIKYDGDKPDLTLINYSFLTACSRAMQYGEKKYGRDNYKGGLKHSRVLSALMRHIFAYNDGHECDTESNLSHLDHIAACVNMLCYMVQHFPELDDRYKK